MIKLIKKLSLYLIIIVNLFIFTSDIRSDYQSSGYQAIFASSINGGASQMASDTYNIHSLSGQPVIGISEQSAENIKDSRFGFLYVLSKQDSALIQEYEIYDIRAFSRSMGQEIQSTTWQKNNDPYFTWKVKLLSESAVIIGYSVALDSQPDEVIDTTETYYDGFTATPISDGKHIFYVKAATTGEVWGDVYSFEFWVDKTQPKAENLDPKAGSVTTNNMSTISLDLYDADSGIDLDSIKLYIDDTPVSFSYENHHLLYTPYTILPDGSRAVRIEAADFAGNVLNMVWGFVVDANIPIGSITINGGDESTTYARVRLNLEASDKTTEVKEMILSNDGVFDTESWENFQALRSEWILYEPQKIGKKTVYCMFKDEAGNISSVYKDDIRLVTAAIDTVITSGPYSPTQEFNAKFDYQSSFKEAVFSYKLDDKDWSEWLKDATISFSNLLAGNHIFSVKSAKDLNEDQIVSKDEEDPLPAQWTWTITTTKEQPKKKPKVIYWKTE